MTRRSFLRATAGCAVAIAAPPIVAAEVAEPAWPGDLVAIREMFAVNRKTGEMIMVYRFYETPSGKWIPL